MQVKERVLTCRLIQKIAGNQSYSSRIGLSYHCEETEEKHADQMSDKEKKA